MSSYQVNAAAPRMSYFQVNAVSIQATARLRRDACTIRGCAARVQGAKKMSHFLFYEPSPRQCTWSAGVLAALAAQ